MKTRRMANGFKVEMLKRMSCTGQTLEADVNFLLLKR